MFNGRIHSHKSKTQWVQSAGGIILPKDCLPKPQVKAFDFFAGCGGFSCGLHQAGIHVVGAMEIDYDAATTYMVNLGSYPMQIHYDTEERKAGFEKKLQKSFDKQIVRKDGIKSVQVAGSGYISHHPEQKGCEHFWIADIRNMTGEMILSWLEMERGELDLVVGGPPCQGFSRAGKQDESDPRNNLVFEYARLIVELNPKTMMMENVPDIVNFKTAQGIGIIEGFCKILADNDYAPFESLMQSLVGRKNVKAVLRAEKKEKVKKKAKPAKVNKQVQQCASVAAQPRLF